MSVDELQQFLATARRGNHLPRIKCRDGFSMSVQVGRLLYCIPRSDIGPWRSVEVGFPSQIEPLLWEYAERPGEWTDTVYPYTPVEIVAAVVELHGGFCVEDSI